MPDFSAKPTIAGESVTLRPATAADAATLHRAMADPEVSRLTGSVHSSDADDADAWSVAELEEIYGRWSTASDRVVWVVIENATGKVVGESVLNDLDEANLSCGFRIWLTARNRGFGTEAALLSVEHAFAIGLNRVELEVYDFNPRARRVYEKLGFVLEGTRRQALRFDGGWVDAHVMAILAEDRRG